MPPEEGIWLVRHAEVGVRGICYGQSDVPTLIDAEAAAALLAERLQSQEGVVRAVWSSPWARARLVGEALARRWELPFFRDPRLSELCFGAWELRAYDEIERTAPAEFAAWMSEYETRGPPGGESALELRGRVAEWLSERRRDRTSIVVITHAGVVRTVRALLRGGRYADELNDSVGYLTPERVPW